MNSRQSEILQIVNVRKKVPVTELSQLTGVSGVTVRQDLNFLERHGYLKRIHGAAITLHSDDLDARMEVHFDIKRQLAEKAANLVTQGETVLIEGGSANALLAQMLAERGDVTIITPSASIAHLLRHSRITVILLGGVYQHQGESLVGPLTRLCIEQTHFSTAFLGIDGFHQDTGFTSRDMMRADIANTIIARNKRTIVVTDSSKMGRICPSSIGRCHDIAVVVTDTGAPPEDMAYLRHQGVQVICENTVPEVSRGAGA